VWTYNNSADQTLERVLRAATGEDVATFAQQHLFDPLGMTHTTMTRDRAGNPQLFEGVHSTCEDMARLGVLVLNHGMWGTRRIVSASWLDASTGQSSTKLNAAYGYLWWLNRPGIIGSPLVATNLKAAANPKTLHGPLVPGAPHDMVWALGLGDQMVQVDPGSHTVVARLGVAGRPTAATFGPAQASRIVTQAVEP
jgi:CubicO group peptidase (beta-lactamase class C family)